MGRSQWCSTKPRTACTRKRACWPGACTPTRKLRRSGLARCALPRKGEKRGTRNFAAALYIGPMNESDAMPDHSVPSRAPAAIAADDTVLPFEVASLDLRGRVVRLGPAVDEILEKHNYPEPVAKLVAEAVVLAVML